MSYNFGIYLTCRPMSSPMLLETAPTLRRLMIPAICGRYGFTRGPKEFTTVPKPFNITVVSSEVCSCWISGQLGWGENVVSNPKHRMTMNWWDKRSWQTRVSLASHAQTSNRFIKWNGSRSFELGKCSQGCQQWVSCKESLWLQQMLSASWLKNQWDKNWQFHTQFSVHPTSWWVAFQQRSQLSSIASFN